MERKKTDIHCHILPGIDDGARNIEVSMELLRKQRSDGVDKIVFTPHFNADQISVEDFVKLRAGAFDKLCAEKEFGEMDISVKLGAEVYYTIDIPQLDLDKLCFEKTNYILIELPTQARPHGMKRTFGNIVNAGYTPIIAHVERYSYMLSDPTQLYDLIELGCLAQINAEALIEKTKATSMVTYFVRHGLVHFMCTDCHSAHRRPANLKEGYAAADKLLGEKYSERFRENGEIIFGGGTIDLDYVKKPAKILGLWV